MWRIVHKDDVAVIKWIAVLIGENDLIKDTSWFLFNHGMKLADSKAEGSGILTIRKKAMPMIRVEKAVQEQEVNFFWLS